MLTLENVSKSYGSLGVLHRVDLRLNPGEMLCLSGPSGIGKSTVLAIASGLEPPGQGQVVSRFNSVGFAFQEPVLLPWKSAMENLAFVLSGKKCRSGAVGRSLLETLGLTAAADKRPHQLSGGMKKRLGLAMALVAEPDLLFLDEPFTFLDREWQNRIADLLLDLNRKKGTAIFMASHELEPARRMGVEILPLGASPLSIRRTMPAAV